ncbi:SRPBCC family protein [Saccharopolyspora gloriosae]|uniref:SRPBCC family protein n=1 Tax=Saccharopolyspora gloriosae TaxID=455344 RepID=UPI001FB6A0DE|nr:SRPBCC family protein [Saccharopolyspora gloriosae]
MTDQNAHQLTLHHSAFIDAAPERIYPLISDITRFSEWSPESTGGEWLTGTPGEVGSRFRGDNGFGDRTWSSECEVLAAEPGKRFAFGVLTGSEQVDNSVWSFEVEPEGSGSRLTQRYVLKELTGPIKEFLAQQEDGGAKFIADRTEALQDALRQTVAGVKRTAEQS